MNTQQVTHAYVSAFVDELVRNGIHDACVCPGSRSTPLAMVLAANPAIKVWMHLDERSAAFFALGFAKTQRKPVILVCTSGTAAANFLPAVVEAHYSHVPLIVLTADRPPELREVGAPQTIDQLRLYGVHASYFVEVALPESTPEALRYIRSVAVRAAAEAMSVPAGPVHLNFPFREPLVPLPAAEPQTVSARPADRPYAEIVTGARHVDPATLKALAADLDSAQHGLIVCGPQTAPGFAEAVTRLAERLNWPILADALSQVRCGPHDRTLVVDAYDAFLRDASFADRTAPDVILRFGQVPTSKPLTQYMQKHAARQILVDGDGGWNDPSLLTSDVIHAELVNFCQNLADALPGLNDPNRANRAWTLHWLETNQHTRKTVVETLQSTSTLFEGAVFPELASLLPDGATLFASSSMPVRDMDTFFPAGDCAIRFLSNRGANGIDGVVSTALGTAAAGAAPVVLVIGDIAFYHDMNGLMAARLHGLNMTIVVINNDGGGIFSFLPQAEYPEHFEQLFGTPHGLDFRYAAEMYGAAYTTIGDWEHFRSAVKRGITSGGLNIVEMRTDRQENVRQHRAVWKVVASALAVQTAGVS